MIDLDWHKSYELGTASIDADHQHLLEIMRGARAAILAKDYPASLKLINELLENARNHFEGEEEFLEKLDYPELEKHKKYHQGLLAQAEITRKMCMEGEDKETHTLQERFERMAILLIYDIQVIDVNLKPFLEMRRT